MQKILGHLRRAARDFDLIADGDKIAVGLSGGKDSLTLLYALALFRRFSPQKFELGAIAVDMGFFDDFHEASKNIAELCKNLDVPLIVEKSQIAQIVEKEENPCSLCAKLRRGALNSSAAKNGFNKVALGHHSDDFLETFLMSLLFEGRLSSFKPKTYLDRTEITVIRPLIYVSEAEIKSAAKKYSMPVLKNPCPADKHTMREHMKTLARDLNDKFPDSKKQMLGALFHPERNNLLDD